MKKTKLTNNLSPGPAKNSSKAARAILLSAALALPSMATAGVVVNENSFWPDDPVLATFANTAGNIEQERDVRFTRNLAQTFQLPHAQKVDKIFIDYEEGLANKEITIRLFSVDDVNSGTLIDPDNASFAGTVYFNLTHTTTDFINPLDGANDPLAVMEFDLTGTDEVTLPASEGTAGYAFQIVRSGAGSDVDNGDERAFKWHWNDGNNFYPQGRSYAITAGGVDGSDDFTFALDGPDEVPPTLVAARGNAALNTLTVVFSEGVDATTATELANYSVVPSLTLSNPEQVTPNTVRFTTSAQTAGTEYTVTVSNVKDDSVAGNTIVANSEIAFKGVVATEGFLTAEFFTNMLPRGTTVGDLLFWPAFTANAPDEVRYLTSFSTPNGYGDDYGARVSAVLEPEETGNYHFFVRSDDASALYINTEGPALPDPTAVAAVAEKFGAGGPFMEPESGDAATTAFPIFLEAGQRYGVVYLLKEGGGGDWGQVAWRKEGDTTPAANLSPMPGHLFETPVDSTGSSVTITQHPSSITAVEGLTATFEVQVDATVPADSIGYQWFVDGEEIPGAYGATAVLDPVLIGDDGAEITVAVRVPGTVVTSDPAILTVTPDETAPTVVSAKAGSDRMTLNVEFSERINPASIANLGNYSVNPSLTLSDPRVVNDTTLQFTTTEIGIGTEYTLTLNNVTDNAGNAIPVNSQVTFFGVGPLLQGDNGYVVWEAENYDRLLGTLWNLNTEGSPSGAGAMAMPDNVSDSEYGDHLEYDIMFTKMGTHYIWVRAAANNPADTGTADSVWLHVYPVDGTPSRPSGAIDRTLSNDAALTGFSGGSLANYVWARNAQSGSSPMTFDIPAPGIYTIGIGSREDGAVLDKFMVTTNPGFTPTGTGPFETPRQGAPDPEPADLAITSHPADQTVFENQPAVFTVTATSNDPLIGYQWQRKVGDTWVDIDGAITATYTLDLAPADWNGSLIRAQVTATGVEVFSEEATLTVITDNTAPTVVSAKGRADLASFTLAFSEAVNPTIAMDLSRYTSPGLTLFGAEMLTDNVVLFSTDAQSVGTQYTVTVNGVTDLAGNAVAANSQATFHGAGPIQQRDDGHIVWEAEDYDRLLGEFWAETTMYDTASRGVSMQSPDNISDNEYNDHLEYDINFTQTGTHTIYVRARGIDGGADSIWLHVYPAGTPATRPTGAIDRTAGNQASMSGFNTGAGDYVWRSDSQDGPDPMTFDIPTPGLYTIGIGIREDAANVDKFFIRTDSGYVPSGLGPLATPRQGEPEPPLEVAFTTHPASLTVVEGREAVFTAEAMASDAFLPMTYQWQRKVGDVFEDIPGENLSTLTISQASMEDNGAVFRATATVSDVVAVSGEATLTVSEDNVLPDALSAGAFTGGTIVGVAFSEEVDPAALGTYVVSGANVLDATVHMGRYVRITLDTAVAPGFTVAVSGAMDLAGNAVAAETLDGQLSDLSADDLGFPVEAGTTFTWGTGYYVAAGGSDLWGNADEGYFVYREFTGAFDMRARIDDLVGGDEWAKAALMARETVDAGSRNQAILITKMAIDGGMDVYNYQWRDATDGGSTSKATGERISPTVFPSWLRLVREDAASNEMKGYISYDGEEWILFHTYTTTGDPLPATLLVGMALTSHDNTATIPMAEAIFENFSIAPFGTEVDPNLAVSKDASGDIVISWDAGTLVSSETVDGDYSPVAGAESPYTVTADADARFFQVIVAP